MNKHLQTIGMAVTPAILATAIVISAPGGNDVPSIAIIGDSTSTGYGTTGYMGGNEDGWEFTQEGWTSRQPFLTGDNYSRNGALVSDFIPDGENNPRTTGPLDPYVTDRVDADITLVLLGANEFGYGTDQEPLVYARNLTRLADRLVGQVIFVHTWKFDFGWPGNEYSWEDYGNAMANVAATSADVEYVDLPNLMRSTTDDTAGLYHIDEYGPGNAVHTTDAGNAVMYAALRLAVECPA